MGRRIIKQPNGKYCVFSSIVDNIIHYDMSQEEIINEYVQEEREKNTEKVKQAILRINLKDNYDDYQDMLSTIKDIHGVTRAHITQAFIENTGRLKFTEILSRDLINELLDIDSDTEIDLSSNETIKQITNRWKEFNVEEYDINTPILIDVYSHSITPNNELVFTYELNVNPS